MDDRWYTSSRLRSNSPVAFLTGRIEARISLPAGLGLWAAFWMLPANDSRGDWAASGEIDIMEVGRTLNTVRFVMSYFEAYHVNSVIHLLAQPIPLHFNKLNRNPNRLE